MKSETLLELNQIKRMLINIWRENVLLDNIFVFRRAKSPVLTFVDLKTQESLQIIDPQYFSYRDVYDLNFSLKSEQIVLLVSKCREYNVPILFTLDLDQEKISLWLFLENGAETFYIVSKKLDNELFDFIYNNYIKENELEEQ